MIRDNIHSDQNSEGVLTRGEANYLGCLELKHQELETLFRQDEASWAENVEIAKRKADEVKDKIQAILERQRLEL